MFELFDHTADLGLRVESDSLAGLFADASQGLSAMVVESPSDLRLEETVTIQLHGDTSRLDDMLFDWLSELLYLFETEHFLAGEVAIPFTRQVVAAAESGEPQTIELTVEMRGERIDPATPRLRLEHEVKAITYHDLEVAFHASQRWHATVIVDI